MTSAAFITRLEKNTFLPPAAKMYFITQAEQYTPEKRDELVAILDRHEKQFLQDSDVFLRQQQQIKQMTNAKRTEDYDRQQKRESALANMLLEKAIISP